MKWNEMNEMKWNKEKRKICVVLLEGGRRGEGIRKKAGFTVVMVSE